MEVVASNAPNLDWGNVPPSNGNAAALHVSGMITDDMIKALEGWGPEATTVTDKTVCLSVCLRKQGTRRKVSSMTDAIKTDTDRKLLTINKQIIDSPELEAIQVLDGQIRSYMKRMALPTETLQRGCYLFPLSLVPIIDEQLMTFKTDREALVAKYQAAYPMRMAEAMGRLGQLFHSGDYISQDEIPFVFKMTVDYLEPVQVPGNLSKVSSHIFKRELDKMSVQCKEILADVESGLVQYLEDFCKHLAASLGKTPDGKLKKLHSTTVQNFQEFLEHLPEMNITNNQQLAALGEKAKLLMNGVDPQKLRKDVDIRGKVQEGVAALAAEIPNLITLAPRRKINFDAD
jgi:hypothetical protein